jgi:chloride channel 3/4/5
MLNVNGTFTTSPISGVMRITVTVVVIMFELTGALTYILPTMVIVLGILWTCFWPKLQIVVLVSKAVGDFFGTSGIADEMIRFNGFPFLDKNDHAFDVSGTFAGGNLGCSMISTFHFKW